MAPVRPTRLWTTILGAPVVPEVSITHSVSARVAGRCYGIRSERHRSHDQEIGALLEVFRLGVRHHGVDLGLRHHGRDIRGLQVRRRDDDAAGEAIEIDEGEGGRQLVAGSTRTERSANRSRAARERCRDGDRPAEREMPWLRESGFRGPEPYATIDGGLCRRAASS